MVRYRLKLEGPSAGGARASGPLLRDLLDVLTEGTRRLVRLQVEGRSTARGTPPAWIAGATAFELVGIGEGSTVLEFEAPTLDEALARYLPQRALFAEIDPAATPFTLLADAMRDVAAGNLDSDRYDAGVLDKIQGLHRVFDAGVNRIELGNRDGEQPLVIEPHTLAAVERLRSQTAPDQYVRVAGILDVIRHSDRMFALILESGATLRGLAGEVTPEQLARLFGRKVIVSGMAAFRPSGRVQAIEAESIQLAEGDVSVWAPEPQPVFDDRDLTALRRPQGPRSGVAALLGTWPGDETDAEIEAFLDELS